MENDAALEVYAVRVLSPHGYYPAGPLVMEDFAVLDIGEIAWSAVHSPSMHLEGVVGATSWFTQDEIRFFGAIALAEAHPRTNGRLWCGFDLPHSRIEVPSSGGNVDPAVLFEAGRIEAQRIDARFKESEHVAWAARKSKFSVAENDYTAEIERLILSIDPDDQLLHRGLYKLLMAMELRRFPQFLEEAALAAFISREAALELLRRKLSDRENKRKKKDDVLEWIHSTFPTGEPFTAVLESDWEARVLFVHPVSEFGEHWSPPVEAEECYDALYTVVYLYRFFLLDEVWIPAEYD